jgi:hypothetical protein
MSQFAIAFPNRDLSSIQYSTLFNVPGITERYDFNTKQFRAIYNVVNFNDRVVTCNREGYYVFINGSIYNPTLHTQEDYVFGLYAKHGIYFGNELDAECCILIVDLIKKKAIVYRDPFGTRPLFVSRESDQLIFSTLYTPLKQFGSVTSVAPGAVSVYSLETFKLLSVVKHHELRFIEYKNCYDHWQNAVNSAIEKRLYPVDKAIVDLSSGYDTGLIFNQIAATNSEFLSITVPTYENREIIKARVDPWRCVDHRTVENTEHTTQKYKEYIRTHVDIDGLIDEFADVIKPGGFVTRGAEINTALILDTGRSLGKSVHISGNGDWYMEDSDDNHRIQNSCTQALESFEKLYLLHTIHPHLRLASYIEGAFGTEMRLPILDFRVVQEYLYLTEELKNRGVKKAAEAYLLKQKGIPFSESIKTCYDLEPNNEYQITDFYSPCKHR